MDCKQKENKEFLIANEVNIDKFDYHAKLPENGVNIRRKKLKLDNNKSVSTNGSNNWKYYQISDIRYTGGKIFILRINCAN